ncbi:hypothetical protein L483_15025 [Pseudomonas putida H8234]|uniref:Uncharacterized protein n=1 Tax=Pseudomonas hunanensis TaxID=1247546 RepID=A0ACC9MYK8_9PSED|nr:hypothetical protein L483_15025 [Pseudomonas putida H8234]PKF23962.1 hypothetical protein CW309_24475 [Pseudomonas hunanensis]
MDAGVGHLQGPDCEFGGYESLVSSISERCSEAWPDVPAHQDLKRLGQCEHGYATRNTSPTFGLLRRRRPYLLGKPLSQHQSCNGHQQHQDCF